MVVVRVPFDFFCTVTVPAWRFFWYRNENLQRTRAAEACLHDSRFLLPRAYFRPYFRLSADFAFDFAVLSLRVTVGAFGALVCTLLGLSGIELHPVLSFRNASCARV